MNSKSESQDSLTDFESSRQTVVDQIRRSLACLGYAQLNSIQCVAEGDEILLTGELDSFYLKQVAQSVAIKVLGVRNVRNEIRVV